MEQQRYLRHRPVFLHREPAEELRRDDPSTHQVEQPPLRGTLRLLEQRGRLLQAVQVQRPRRRTLPSRQMVCRHEVRHGLQQSLRICAQGRHQRAGGAGLGLHRTDPRAGTHVEPSEPGVHGLRLPGGSFQRRRMADRQEVHGKRAGKQLHALHGNLPGGFPAGHLHLPRTQL